MRARWRGKALNRFVDIPSAQRLVGTPRARIQPRAEGERKQVYVTGPPNCLQYRSQTQGCLRCKALSKRMRDVATESKRWLRLWLMRFCTKTPRRWRGDEFARYEKHTLQPSKRLKDVTQSEPCRSAEALLLRRPPKGCGVFLSRCQDTNGCNQGDRARRCEKLHETIAWQLKQAATGLADSLNGQRAGARSGARCS